MGGLERLHRSQMYLFLLQKSWVQFSVPTWSSHSQLSITQTLGDPEIISGLCGYLHACGHTQRYEYFDIYINKKQNKFIFNWRKISIKRKNFKAFAVSFNFFIFHKIRNENNFLFNTKYSLCNLAFTSSVLFVAIMLIGWQGQLISMACTSEFQLNPSDRTNLTGDFTPYPLPWQQREVI